MSFADIVVLLVSSTLWCELMWSFSKSSPERDNKFMPRRTRGTG